ncbi:hypothetical protein ACS386_13170 [Flavobacteriaceae bacterium LMO-SS05]
MRTNNYKVKNIIISAYFVLIIFAILLATVFSGFSHLTPNPTLTFFLIFSGFIILFFFVHRNSKYFEYDSDGIKVVIMNKGLLLSDYFNYREHKMEFAKENLVAYKFNNYWIYKSLTVHVKDRKGNKRKETFNVTLVAKKKRNYIRQSLSKTIKLNRKLE